MNRKIDLDEMIKDYKECTLDEVFVEEVLDDLNDCKKFYKPVVPQFVADWYEEHKDDLEYDIWEYILRWGKQQKSEFYEWMNHANNKPLQTLVNMHQFGYEVEKEKRYCISIPKTRNHKNNAQYLCSDFGKMFWCGEWYRFQTKFTRKELEEAEFGWVFDCPGIEVEEVKK